eukprot:NODE_5435_length_676_cov_57.789474_g5060_i0.p2 GENE.NODE_5435_length_676_cov_57.789474_g5060_i0~~NODE_5435_length_676_cov_57.789474_g5060_i0.p2  ORF type:complete len:150 (+),score=39.50 NODE_5435_length_676_cov_57.789474_g5060_i0:45-452(+)
MPVYSSKFEKIDVSDDETEETAPATTEPKSEPIRCSSSSASSTVPLKAGKKLDENDRDDLADEISKLIKAFEIERAGSRVEYDYWMIEIDEAEVLEDGRVKCLCDVEHKGYAMAAEKHFKRTYMYDRSTKTVSLP